MTDRACPVCSSAVVGRSDKVYCSKPCLRAGNQRACGIPGCANVHIARGLCNTHYNAQRYPDKHLVWRGDREAKRKRDRTRTQMRRAATRGAHVERVDRDAIGHRDHWVCGICITPIDSQLAYPDSASASLDHVVPLSKGGEHTEANTRITHLRCNVKRQATDAVQPASLAS